jgi:hypothetical protein
MIANDLELKTTQERIAYFQQLLAQMRVAARPAEYPAMSSGYLCEIEKMQGEIREYLAHHASQTPPSDAA